MAKVELKSTTHSVQIDAIAGQGLRELLQQHFPEYPFPCGGAGTCGKCLVRVQGNVNSASKSESRLLREHDDFRLACYVEIQGDCSIEIPTDAGRQRIESTIHNHVTPGRPLYNGEFGFSVDIGTTTVVAYLFKRGNNSPDAIVSEVNAQKQFGNDVIARIAHANRNTVHPLQLAIRRQLNHMFLELCRKTGISANDVGGACIAGNTVMLHLLAGHDPRSLGEAPFSMVSAYGDLFNLEFPDFPKLRSYLTPCISAYVGGDVVCSILASNMLAHSSSSLLIDAGTNGEIVLWSDGQLLCCSAAAGPAFEGTNISCGMQAQDGAIDAVWVNEGQLDYSVIGGGKAEGICGSGVIDVLYAARRVGLLDRKGRPTNSEVLHIGRSGLYLTRKDIGEVLLAKGAIRGAIETLLNQLDLRAEHVNHVIFCGGFGNYIKPESAVGIGMIPSSLSGKIVSIGNAAGAGASMALQNIEFVYQLEEISNCAEVLELSYSQRFQKEYIRNIYFPNGGRD